MRDILPAPPAVVRNELQSIQDRFRKNVIPSYGRFDLALERGEGSRVWDINGKCYLDLGGGIAVNALGHASPDITAALIEQSGKLSHISNLYYQQPQGLLAEQLAGLSATGQPKVKKGFEPMVPGFRQIPFNDLAAARASLSPATAAILIEGVQGEIGVLPASAEYLLGLRQLCDEKKLLLLMDGVQCGHFRTGRFQSFQRILEDAADRTGADGFLPDGIAMAKSLGAGF